MKTQDFSEILEKEDQSSEPKSLEFVHDVPLPCSVEFGRTEMTIKQLLTLTPGSVIVLDKEEGEPVEIKANGKTLAKGEVVVVNDQYGVRVTLIED